jgi:two-component system chemotaxis sensor kinase CheA
MEKNLQRFREVFLEEAQEHLEIMESSLLGIEAGGSADSAILNQIFRSAHTIKGGSGMFGLDQMARFTHSLENLLDQMRAGKIEPTRPLIDTLLRSCDVLKALLAFARQDDATVPQEMGDVLEAIQQASAPSSTSARTNIAPAEPAASITELRSESKDEGTWWRIRLSPGPDVLRRGLNPRIAFGQLAELGELGKLEMDTSTLPPLEKMDPEENYLVWTMRLRTAASEDAIRDVFEFLHDGSGLDVVLEGPVAGTASQEPGAMAHGVVQAESTAGSSESPASGSLLPSEASTQEAPAPSPNTPNLSTKTVSAQEPTTPPAGQAQPGHTVSGQTHLGQQMETTISAPVQNESNSTIRVDVDLLDRLMNQVGELVLARNQILQFANANEDGTLIAASQRLNLITSELQEGVMKTRMQPIGVAWSMMPRLVRDLAVSCGKQIQLDMEGAETELDRTIIEAIKDPLTHLVRNACDHGLETPAARTPLGKNAVGKLLLRAFHEGGHVMIEIADDGGGIDATRVKNKAVEKRLITPEQAARMSDREACHLIFLPGFSTAERVSDISGRGVGMDVVKTNIERIGGAVDLSTAAHKGTTVRIKIPLTLAIIPGMVVESGGERFIIPQVSLVELVRLEEHQAKERIEHVQGAPVCKLRGKLLPLVYLNQILNLEDRRADDAVSIVVLQAEDRQFGLVVDAIRDTQEIVVKPLAKQLKGLVAYSGATIMGDGQVALILDVPGLAQLAGFGSGTYSTEKRTSTMQESETKDTHHRAMLLFRASGFERVAVPLALVSRLEEFPRERVERAGGRQVVQYRGRILPLVSMDKVCSGMDTELEGDPLQAIVFMDGGRGVGLVVGEILDIVEDSMAVRKEGRRQGLLGSAVVSGRVTDILDLEAVLESSGQRWLNSGGDARSATVLVAGASTFTRSLIRSSVEMAGHQVVEAESTREVMDRISRDKIDLVAISADLKQATGGGSLIAMIRKQAGRDLPVLALGAHSVQDNELEGMNAFLDRMDGEQMTSTIQSLLAQV